MLLGVVVTLGLVARRPLIELLSSAAGESSRQAQVDLGVFLLWFVLPQLLLYGAGLVGSDADSGESSHHTSTCSRPVSSRTRGEGGGLGSR